MTGSERVSIAGSVGARALLAAARVAACALLLSGPVTGTACAAEPKEPAAVRPEAMGVEVCLSLRELASRAQAGLQAHGRLSEEVATMAGIGWVTAYVVDEKGGDVIVVGRRSDKWPPLLLDDLALNMRVVWAGTGYPGCSLDPRPEDVAKMAQIAANAHPASVADMRGLFARVQDTWGPQNVVVMGVPPASHHAHVMVDADYHMKKMSQGLASAGGVTSLMDRPLARTRKALEAGLPAPAVGLSMSRFWFHLRKGAPTFKEDDGVAVLDQCEVAVLTEAQRATADGVLYDSGGVDEDASAFAEEFSGKLLASAAEVPAYAELVDLYRLRSLLQLMRMRGADKKGRLDTRFYLERYRPQRDSPMPDTMPGLSNFREEQFDIAIGGRRGRAVLFPIVCGGVSMQSSVTEAQVARDATGKSGALKELVLSSRPAGSALSWSLPRPVGLPTAASPAR